MGVFGFVRFYWKWDASFWRCRVPAKQCGDRKQPRDRFSFCSPPFLCLHYKRNMTAIITDIFIWIHFCWYSRIVTNPRSCKKKNQNRVDIDTFDLPTFIWQNFTFELHSSDGISKLCSFELRCNTQHLLCAHLGTIVFHWQRHTEGQGSRFSSVLFAVPSDIWDVMLILWVFFSLVVCLTFRRQQPAPERCLQAQSLSNVNVTDESAHKFVGSSSLNIISL